MVSITENEGNARLTTSLPKVHVAIMGIEKLLPKLSDLALFLPMLGTAGAGQALTGYNTMFAGPRQPGEVDGRRSFTLSCWTTTAPNSSPTPSSGTRFIASVAARA